MGAALIYAEGRTDMKRICAYSDYENAAKNKLRTLKDCVNPLNTELNPICQ